MIDDAGTGVTIRAAEGRDTEVLLCLIREHAAYEGQADVCVVTEPALRSALFGPRPLAEAIVAEEAGEPVGFALFFPYFSPYPGVPGLFMELLYVVPELRRQGIGQALLRRVARIAVERGAGRLEWGVLKANESAIRFYTRLGATLDDDFVACRLEGDTLRRVAEGLPTREPDHL
jgi:GNAT superfamily N-acetyltransferase